MTELNKPIELNRLLTLHKVKMNDEVKWAWYAYGFLDRTGTNRRENIPSPVAHGKCFAIADDGTYLVDGAL